MRRRSLILCAAVIALATAGVGTAAAPVTQQSDTLTVGVAMPSEGFQVGVVKGSQVIYAQGFEIDLARALAKQLGLRRTVFVQDRFDRLLTGGEKPYDLALAEISITDARKATLTFSRPYMTVDQGVLVAPTVRPIPRTIAALKPLRLCALRKTTGAEVAQQTIAPTRPVQLVGNVPTLMLNLQIGKCDAVVYDAPALTTLKARAPERYGPFAGVIKTGETYGVAFTKGSTLVGPVNRALAALLADGTVDRLSRSWLTLDSTKLPVLR
jgi:ABC-type amino acid transport substrate-binding protein